MGNRASIGRQTERGPQDGAAAAGIFLADSQGRLVWANPAASQITGYSTSELLALSLTQLVPAEDFLSTPHRLADLLADGVLDTERRVRRKDGTLVHVALHWMLLPDGHVLGTARPAAQPLDAAIATAQQPPAEGRLILTTMGRAALESVSPSGERTELLVQGKPLALLVYLACTPERAASREHLVDLLWADNDVDSARHSVRQATWLLRQRLGESGITPREGDITLRAAIDSDRAAFLEAIQLGHLERAVELFGGDFLPGFVAPGGAAFEQWADAERFRLRRLFIRLAESLVHDWLAKGSTRKAVALAQRVRDADPRSESGWRLVLASLVAADDRLTADLEARALEWQLIKSDRRPEPATQAVLDRVHAAAVDLHVQRPSRVLAAELVGREREFATILRAWDATRRSAGGRAVHIIGAAGLGKTRLLSDVHARLRASGGRSVLVRANPGERAVPWALASEVAAALAHLPGGAAVSPASASALVALNPALSSCYSAAPDHATGPEALRRRELAIADLLRAVADEQPLALLIDDVHWADDESRQVLSHLLSRTLALPVLAVTSARSGLGGAVGRVSGEQLVLEPLDDADTTGLLNSLARLPNAPWAARLPHDLNATARGVPLLILETLQLLLERGALVLDDGVWGCSDEARLGAELATGGALVRRIQELERSSRWLLVILAVAGAPLAVDLLVRLSSRGRGAVEADLHALELRGLALRDGVEWRPAHDEIAARALELASPGAVRAANAGLGRHLAVTGRDDPGVLHRAGRHLATASEDRELTRVLRRRLVLQRRHGERRSARVIATELLGDAATPAGISRLVRSLPLHVRLGLVTPLRIAAVIATVAGVAIGTTAAILHANAPPPDIWLVAIRQLSDDSLSAIEIPLRREGWDHLDRLDALRLGRTVPAVRSDRADAAPSPDGTAWVYGRTMLDSGDIDLLETGVDGVERRLTTAPGDDDHASWSPDGRSVAFSTTRWSANRFYDIAILDIATGRVRRLTFDNGSGNPQWSPDGLRIGFTHEDRRTPPDAAGHSRSCWITVDGGFSACLDPAMRMIGWYDAEQVLVTMNTPSQPLGRLDLRTGEWHPLADGLNGSVEASADGRWVSCYCIRSGTTDRALYLFPTDRPDLWRPVMHVPASSLLRFVAGADRRPYIDRLEIVAPTDTLPLNTRYHLQARALDTRGAELPLDIVSWRSIDTSVARVDQSGVITPLRPGVATIAASTGGWRAATRSFTIVAAAPQSLLKENWTEPLATHWVSYGTPLPVIDTGPGNRPAFWNHGDGWYESGAYSRATFDASHGLGVEAWWSTPVTGPRQQYLAMTLIPGSDSVALSRWDHRSASPPLRAPSCTFAFPVGDGVPTQPFVNLGAGPVFVPSSLLSGQWYRIRVQVFPDGRCGYALNGNALAVSKRPQVPLTPAYHLVLHGNSLGNRMLVGLLQLWTGVPDDVDWGALDRPSTSLPVPQPLSSHPAASPTESPRSVPLQRTPRPPR